MVPTRCVHCSGVQIVPVVTTAAETAAVPAAAAAAAAAAVHCNDLPPPHTRRELCRAEIRSRRRGPLVWFRKKSREVVAAAKRPRVVAAAVVAARAVAVAIVTAVPTLSGGGERRQRRPCTSTGTGTRIGTSTNAGAARSEHKSHGRERGGVRQGLPVLVRTRVPGANTHTGSRTRTRA
jgi:hypothetical protein